MVHRAAEELGEPAPRRGRWTVGDIVARAAEEQRCRAILDDAEGAATALVAACCTLLNPAAVVLGGGLFKGWPELRGTIERFCDEWCSEAVRSGVRFYESRGDADAILWGAAQATRALW